MVQHKAWVAAVDMGYGHQRAAYPLRHLSPTDKVIIANNYEGIPKKDRRVWKSSQSFYEFFSRSKNVPVIGNFLFDLFIDRVQRIPEFYPRRDLSRPTIQLRSNYRLIRRGWGRDLINYFNTEDIPLVTTFFTIAFMAEEHKFKGEIYLVCCDSDVSRTWAPLVPGKSRINYIAPCRRVAERLKQYGVREDHIFLTGFPLPEENIGKKGLETIKHDLTDRIVNLDPERRYRKKYMDTIKTYLTGVKPDEKHTHPLTLTFAVGGAGAQRDLAVTILRSLKNKLLAGEININLVAGTRNDVYLFFKKEIKRLELEKVLNKNLTIVFALEKQDYFTAFNKIIRVTDVLWTKPSELVFYTALGIPVIIAEPLGSQEVFNKRWLKTVGAGISAEDPRYTAEWFFDWVNTGWLAEAAMSGFLDGRQFGVKNIEDVVFHGVSEPTKNNNLL